MTEIKLITWGFFIFLCLAVFLNPIAANSNISNYQVIFKPYYEEHGLLRLAIRQYDYQGKQQFLVINPFSLQSSVVAASTVHFPKKYQI